MTGDSFRRRLRDLDRSGLAKLVAVVCIHEGYRPQFRTSGGELTVLAHRPGRSVERIYWIDTDATATVPRIRSFDALRRRERIARAAATSAAEYDDDVREAAADLGIACLAPAELAELVASDGLEFYVSDLASDPDAVDLDVVRKRFEEPLVKDRQSDDGVYFRNVDR